jgi:VanZ family protein
MHFDLRIVNIPSLVIIKFRPLPLCLLLLFFVIMISAGSVPGQANHLSAHAGDKLLHFMAYGLMTFLSFQSITGSRITRILVSLLVIASLGLIDEGIQYFLPYRNASLSDWFFDVAAAVVVTFFLGLRHSES